MKDIIKIYVPYADYTVYKMMSSSDYLSVVAKYFDTEIELENGVFYSNGKEVGRFDHNYAIINIDGKKLGLLLQTKLNHIIIYIDTKDTRYIQEHFIYNYYYTDNDFLVVVLIDGSEVKYPKSWVVKVED